MSKDGPPSGGIYYDPWYRPRPVHEVNASLRAQKLIRQVGKLSEVLRAEGHSTDEILENQKIKDLIAQLAGRPHSLQGSH